MQEEQVILAGLLEFFNIPNHDDRESLKRIIKMKILKQQHTITINLDDKHRQLLDCLSDIFGGVPSESEICILGLVLLSRRVQKENMSLKQRKNLFYILKDFQILTK